MCNTAHIVYWFLVHKFSDCKWTQQYTYSSPLYSLILRIIAIDIRITFISIYIYTLTFKSKLVKNWFRFTCLMTCNAMFYCSFRWCGHLCSRCSYIHNGTILPFIHVIKCLYRKLLIVNHFMWLWPCAIFFINTFNPTDRFRSIQNNAWKSPVKLLSVEGVNYRVI